MKKIITGIVLGIAFSLIVLSVPYAKGATIQVPDRLVVADKLDLGFATYIEILYDRHSNVDCYVIYRGGAFGGISCLPVK